MSVPELSHDGARTARGAAFRVLFALCAALSILTTIAIVLTLVLTGTVEFFAAVPVVEFLTGTRWSPTNDPVSFGVLPLVSGTLVVTVGAAMIALPIGLLTAIYLSEYASDRRRSVLKPALEVLAGVPTVIYGYFALVYITPALDTFLPLSTFNALSASIVVGIMIVPMVSSISEDAMHAVPDSLRQAGYGLGATKFTVSTSVVVPAALSGIFSSFILALSRAIGETMAVTIAAGQTPRMVELTDPAGMFLDSIQTMTAAMVQIGASDVVGQSIAYKSLFAVGLALFVITFAMNVASEWVTSRYREVYE